MLLKCQQNLIRWDIEADLFVGNAEDLPFTNESVDVVFHTGGIKFFNDRAKSIREMIRVAKPGSRTTFWTHLHCGEIPKSGDKYVISSFVRFALPGTDHNPA